MTHTLPQLPYEYNAIEPVIDEETMRIHHTKHHQAYIDKLNAALEAHSDLQSLPIEKLVQDIQSLPNDIQMVVRNNGGGHFNHSFFWKILAPSQTECSGKISELITAQFGSYDEFVSQFVAKAVGQFGSGWAWLVIDSDKKLSIITTPNQDVPDLQAYTLLVGVDVWEHAYYLKYQNKRPDYVKAVLTRINWDVVNTALAE